MQNSNPMIPLVGRVLIAAVFLFSGLGKIAAPSMIMGAIGSVGLPAPVVGLVLAVIVEVGGGICLVLGYQTRIVAAALALFSVATAVFFHRDFIDQNQAFNFLKNLAMAGGLLQVVAFGAGALSLDRRLSARAAA